MKPPRYSLYIALLLFIIAGVWLKESPGARESISKIIPAWSSGTGAKVGTVVQTFSVTPSHSAASTGPHGNHTGATLFNEDRRSLLASNDLAKIDRAVLGLHLKCGDTLFGFDMVQKMRRYGYHNDHVRGTPKGLGVGKADENQKMAALRRYIENCKHLQGEPPVSAEEMAAFRTQPAMRQYGAIDRGLDFRNGPSTPEAQAALAQAVSTPMFEQLQTVMFRHLDYSDLEKAYPQDQGEAMPYLARDLVLCKLGDDCHEGGLLADRLCWQSAICGSNAEAAILENLRALGLDTAALNAFVTKVHLALQAGDVSIFKRAQKTGK